MQTFELDDGGILLYQADFLPAGLADRYFAELRDTAAWEQKAAPFGHLQPRLTASYGDPGLTYYYSGTENHAHTWTPTLLELKRRVEEVQGAYNYCLLNRYRSGADSVGMHADNEPGMGNVIGSLSLGATRTFRIRHNRTKESRSLIVAHGTLIVMVNSSRSAARRRRRPPRGRRPPTAGSARGCIPARGRRRSRIADRCRPR